MKSRTWSWVVALVAIGFASSVLTGCGQQLADFQKKLEEKKADLEKAKDQKKDEEPKIIIPVEARRPYRGDISAYFETTTRVVAENRVDILSKGIGECLDVMADEGDTVQKGQVLAELDKNQAEAALGQAEVQVRKAQSDLLRAQKMFKAGFIAQAEFDNVRFAYEQGQAALKTQRIQLDNMTVRSPMDGVVTTKRVQKGQLVSSGVALFSIVDPSSYILTINPPEKELHRLKEGQGARCTVDSSEDQEFDATVRRINPGVDAQSGTVKVTLDVAAEVRPLLREAAFARVRLVMETHPNALLAPKDAIVEENGRKYLFLVAQAKPETDPPTSETQGTEADAAPPADSSSSDKGSVVEAATTPVAAAPAPSELKLVAERVEVSTGLEDSDSAEILSGIDDNSLIITLGQQTLKAGAEIKVTTAQAELEAKSGLPAEDALKSAEEKRAEQKRTNTTPTGGSTSHGRH